MDYTGAERLKTALEKLERYIQSGGGLSGSEGGVDTAELTALKQENEALKFKQLEISEEVDGLIAVVENALKAEDAA